MSLYQKYRPKNFNQVVGQDFITTSLKNALTKDKVTHAYLLHGPRGTGKTSIARIFAKAINCLDLTPEGNPCEKCAHCLATDNGTFFDMVELDAASHNKVDDIRELIDQMRFPPSQGKYKVYIIDEVHMVTDSAFNALLKTLEEPPAHGKFILATTEIHKMPDTIISRTLRYDFRRISDEDIVNRLAFIAKEEGFVADEKSLKLIARFAKGWLRDAIGLLEQYASSGDLTLESVSAHLGMVDEAFLEEFLIDLEQKNEDGVAKKLHTLYERNVDMRHLIEQFLFALRNLIISQKTSPATRRFCIRVFDSLEDLLVRIRHVPDMFMSFEMVIYGLLWEAAWAQTVSSLPASIEKKSPAPIKTKAPESEATFSETKSQPLPPEEGLMQKAQKDIPAPIKEKSSSAIASFWPQELQALIDYFSKKSKMQYVGLSLKFASLSGDANNILFSVSSGFHLQKLDTNDVRAQLCEALNELYSFTGSISFKQDSSAGTSLRGNDLLSDAKNIF